MAPNLGSQSTKYVAEHGQAGYHQVAPSLHMGKAAPPLPKPHQHLPQFWSPKIHNFWICLVPASHGKLVLSGKDHVAFTIAHFFCGRSNCNMLHVRFCSKGATPRLAIDDIHFALPHISGPHFLLPCLAVSLLLTFRRFEEWSSSLKASSSDGWKHQFSLSDGWSLKVLAVSIPFQIRVRPLRGNRPLGPPNCVRFLGGEASCMLLANLTSWGILTNNRFSIKKRDEEQSNELINQSIRPIFYTNSMAIDRTLGTLKPFSNAPTLFQEWMASSKNVRTFDWSCQMRLRLSCCNPHRRTVLPGERDCYLHIIQSWRHAILASKDSQVDTCCYPRIPC